MGCSQSKAVAVKQSAPPQSSAPPPQSQKVEKRKDEPLKTPAANSAPTSTNQNSTTANKNGQKETINSPNTAVAPSHTSETVSADSISTSGPPGSRPRFASYASGASTPECHSDNDEGSTHSNRSGSHRGVGNGSFHSRRASNPKSLTHSTSQIGLDEMIEDRRDMGDIRQNIVHIEVPFGKPIEEVYDGVHSGPVLGSGISGLVRLVTHKATGLKYAVKVLDLGLVDTSDGLRQLREEIFIMCQLDHPNIVRLEEVYESQSEIYLVQELCLGGELFDRLDEQPDYHYTEAECARLVKQMLSAVRYLHSKGIIHRDLKLENFLFSSTAKDSELKMIDFGLSKHFRYGEVQHEAVGTPYTVAPEVIRGSYDERCDIWAIGVITFLLLSGDPPFGGCGGPEPLMQVRANILSGSFEFEPEDIWANVSSVARSFICELLKTDPKERPTARNAQHHQWLQEWASRSRKGKDNNLNPNVVKALVNFKEFSDMRKLLCEVLSFTLLPYQIKELRREFEKMDTDGSGEISLAALKQVLVANAGAGSLGALTEEEVEDIFNAMRVRKTETRIHWHEFIAAGLSQCQVDDRNLRLAFDRLDSDHKGYIVLDDIMDLLGSDAFQSEEAMHRMWGDSVQAVKGQHARITYDDFLLLMKGQTKDNPREEGSGDFQASTSSLVNAKLHPVPESTPDLNEEPLEKTKVPSEADEIKLPSGDIVNKDGTIIPAETNAVDTSQTPQRPTSPVGLPKSAPTTPADHKKILDDEGMDSPLSMDVDYDITSAGPGVPGNAASLTPPVSPSRGARDYITPGANRTLVDFQNIDGGLALPGFPTSGAGPSKPQPYVRGRSRSLDEKDQRQEVQNLHVVADVVRDMLLPETDHSNLSRQLEEVVKDESKSALVVNRKLYRAHRQMRLAVLEASKRFEEQQAEHARQLILAARVAKDEVEKGMGMIQAGLVMRHGHTKQVSSQDIRKLLEENRAQQQALVEKANRRGGRGRRSRKKTTSDMSGMLSSLGQEEMTKVAMRAAADSTPENATIPTTSASKLPPIPASGGPVVSSESAVPTLPDLKAAEGTMRGATVPGEFRKTSDPFGSHGKYGAAQHWE